MAFRTNTSKAQEGGNSLKPEGDYEVIIDAAEVTRTQSGKDKINIVYVIRNDVQQKYQNGLIFHSVWKKKEPNEDDMQIGGYNFGQLMAIASAAKLPDNQEFAGLDDFLKALCGKAMRVHLYHDGYNDKYYEKIDLHQPTEYPEIKHKEKPKPNASGYAAPQTSFAQAADKTPQVGDDDYPF